MPCIFYCKPKGVTKQNHLNLEVGDSNQPHQKTCKWKMGSVVEVTRISQCVPVLVPSRPCSIHYFYTNHIMACSNQTPFNELWIYTQALLNGPPHLGLVDLKLLTKHRSISKSNTPPVVWSISSCPAANVPKRVGTFLQIVTIWIRKSLLCVSMNQTAKARLCRLLNLLSIWCSNIFLEL